MVRRLSVGVLVILWFLCMQISVGYSCHGWGRKTKTQEGRKGGIETSWETERRGQQRGGKGGSDGCEEANSATFSIFAWHCHPCQLLNASVSQTSVQLASAPPLHGCGCSASIALISGVSQHLPGTTRSHKHRHLSMHAHSWSAYCCCCRLKTAHQGFMKSEN